MLSLARFCSITRPHSNALINALLAFVGSGSDDLDLMIDRDRYHAVGLHVPGSPVVLVDQFGNFPFFDDVDLLLVRDLHGNLDLVSLGDLVDHDIPLAGYLSAAGVATAVGDAAVARGLTGAVAVSAAAVLGLASGDRVEGNFDGV